MFPFQSSSNSNVGKFFIHDFCTSRFRFLVHTKKAIRASGIVYTAEMLIVCMVEVSLLLFFWSSVGRAIGILA